MDMALFYGGVLFFLGVWRSWNRIHRQAMVLLLFILCDCIWCPFTLILDRCMHGRIPETSIDGNVNER